VKDAEPQFTIREAVDDDIGPIVRLAGAALGWRPGDPNDALFRWKHLENPFGRSAMWVAEADDGLIGFRAYMRWSFVEPGGAVLRAARAVDTATHPDHQGRGIFSKLTMHGLDGLRDEGVAFVFNTPNDQSRPGYLKLGWREIGRLGVAATVRRPHRLLTARRPADKWSLPNDAGVAVAEILDRIRSTGPDAITTLRTPEYLDWRYRFEPLAYRGFDHPDGRAIFRLRSRGRAVECTACELDGGRRLLRALARETHADYVLVAGRPAGTVPVVGQGPIVTTRDVAGVAPVSIDQLALALGDVELF